MLLNEYQAKAVDTAIYPGQGTFSGLIYTTLKLNGEAGEVAEKVGKIIRDDGGKISNDKKDALILELGDVLWYIANTAKELNVTLDYVTSKNLDKLFNRKERNKLSGSGDNR